MQVKSSVGQLRNAIASLVLIITASLFNATFAERSVSAGDHGINASSTITIDYVAATVYGNYIMVYGHVSDSDGSVVGNTVNVSGDINGSAQVGANGNFAFVVPVNAPYGEFQAQATDGQYNSPVKYSEFSA